MAEHPPINDPALERLTKPDESIQRFHADIRDANIILQEDELNLEDISELVEGLDEDWPYLHTMCVVAGRVYRSDGEELLLEGDKVVSLGASLVARDGEDKKLYRYLGVMEEGEFIEGLWADPDDDSIDIKPLAGVDGASIEALEYHYPDLKSDIDFVLLNSGDAVDAVKKLSGFVFEHNPDKVDPDEYRSMVENYLNNLLIFKDIVPYSLAFRGVYFSAKEEASGVFRRKKAMAWQRKIAKPVRVLLLSVSAMKGDTSIEEDTASIPALMFSGVNPDIEGDEEDMIVVPISSSYFRLASNMERVREGFEGLDFE